MRLRRVQPRQVSRRLKCLQRGVRLCGSALGRNLEPAKWVAKLRATGTGTQPLVFRTNMEAGHGGKSGRFRRYREQAEYLAFALQQLGVEGR